MRRRSCCRLRKSSLVARYSSPGIPNLTGSAPAATRKWRASRVSPSTRSVLGPVKCARPWKVSMPLSAYICSCFGGTASVKLRLNPISAGQSTCSSPATPCVRMRDAKSMTSAAETSIFFGSHPRSAQVPPNGRKSITATVQPAARTRIAAVIAAVPVPTITRSYRFAMALPLRRGRRQILPVGTLIQLRRQARIFLLLPCAAGKLLHVPCEGLSCELQAFDHREVRKQLVGQFLCCHLRPDGERRRLNEFACFRRHRLHADQPTAAFLDN